MRSLTQAILYPGVGIIETTNVSVGRGTDTPFEIVGAPWMAGRKVAAHLNAAELAGVRFIPIEFTPESSKHKGKLCQGVNLQITNRDRFHPLRTGIELARTLHKLHPDDWDTKSLNRLLSSKRTLRMILDGKPTDSIQAAWGDELQAFLTRRASYLLYE